MLDFTRGSPLEGIRLRSAELVASVHDILRPDNERSYKRHSIELLRVQVQLR